MFKVGDYVIDPFGCIFHLTSKREKEIINCSSFKFRLATEEEIEHYHKCILK